VSADGFTAHNFNYALINIF